MKGLIYVFAFWVGFVAPNSFPCPQSVFADVETPVASPESGDSSGSRDSAVQQAVQNAKVVLNAPTRGRVGELIRFDLTKSEADSVNWIVRPATPDFETYDDGRRAVFSARAPGEYVFFISVAKGGTVDALIHTVKIEGPPERPSVDDLSLWIPFWAYELNLPKTEATKLAESFEDVAGRITALSTPKGIIEATGEANRAALGGSLEIWKPLLSRIQGTLVNRAKAGTLTTPEQHKATWTEIAKGLYKIAR